MCNGISHLHLGCGLDSRVLRVGTNNHCWYDVDFPAVIKERSRYFYETENYCMIGADVRENGWLDQIRGEKAIVVMEGVSMYLKPAECRALMVALSSHFGKLYLLMDCYTEMAAKFSRYKNPINDVGVTRVYGLDDPTILSGTRLKFVKEHDMTPRDLIDQLQGAEKAIFSRLYAGKIAQKMYRLYEYEGGQGI